MNNIENQIKLKRIEAEKNGKALCIKCKRPLSYYRYVTQMEDIHEVCSSILSCELYEYK